MEKKLVNDFIKISLEIQKLMEKRSKIHPDINERPVPKLQFFTLKLIFENPGLSVGELADMLSMSSSSIAQLLDRLVMKDWIRKDEDEQDKRIFHLYLTKRGKQEISKMAKIFRGKMVEMLSLMSEEELRQMIKILNNLLTKLKKEKC